MKIIINKDKIQTTSQLNSLNKIVLPKKNSFFYNQETNSNESSIEDLILKLEVSPILNYPYDFLSLDEDRNKIDNTITINLVDNVNNAHLSNDFEHYDLSTGEITITEKLLFNEQFLPTNFAEELYAAVGQHKLLNFAIFHEIGHAIQHQLYLHQHGQFLASTHENLGIQNSFFNFIKLNSIAIEHKENNPFSLHRSVSKAISEGFADLYACICIEQLYEKKVAIPFIEEIIGARQRSSDYYYSSEVMIQFLKQVKNNAIQFHDFEEMKDYMNESISEYTLSMMIDKFLSSHEHQIQHNNQFLGYLKSTLKIPDLTQCLNSQDIITVLKEFIPDLAKCEEIQIRHNEFIDGVNHGTQMIRESRESKNSLTQHYILANIMRLRTVEQYFKIKPK